MNQSKLVIRRIFGVILLIIGALSVVMFIKTITETGFQLTYIIGIVSSVALAWLGWVALTGKPRTDEEKEKDKEELERRKSEREEKRAKKAEKQKAEFRNNKKEGEE